MNKLFDTRITELFGTRLPIVAGCMQNLSTADYVSAVAHTGMMTFLASATYPDLDQLRAGIRRCKTLCAGNPLGVNVSMLPKLIEGEKTDQVFDLIIEEGADRIEPLAEIVKRLENETQQAMHRLKTLYQSINQA